MRQPHSLSRRSFLARSARLAQALGAGLVGTSLWGRSVLAAGAGTFGELQRPDSNGLRLPPGFRSRIVATSGRRIASTGHHWHAAPDGGATFETPEGGWIYVSNSEVSHSRGGVGAIRFTPNGEIENAYSILSGTSRNCAGGPTPWKTWLSCEETATGRVYECDPFVPGGQGTVRPALGVFRHEAAAVDPVHRCIYMTEDQPDGLLYRFVPTDYPSLGTGRLEAAEVLDPDTRGEFSPGESRTLIWHSVPDPSAARTPTRYQVSQTTPFKAGEGCWYAGGKLFMATKGDNRIWQIETSSLSLSLLYDYATAESNALYNVDNVFATSAGDVYVAEDPGNLEIVALTADGGVKPIVRLTGQSGTEVTGPALSPDGTRLYFSSQRNPGITYEVAGPFIPPSAPSSEASL